MTIDTADEVLHGPSGETWLVAVVDGDRLIPCGWPLSYALLSDCTVTKAATDDERVALLHRMADMQDRDDPRCRHGLWRLGMRGAGPTGAPTDG